MMKIEIPGKRTRGRPRRRWNDNIKEDMKKANVSEEEAEDPLGGKAKKKKKKS